MTSAFSTIPIVKTLGGRRHMYELNIAARAAGSSWNPIPRTLRPVPLAASLQSPCSATMSTAGLSAGSLPAKRFMVLGLDEDRDLSLESLRVVGRIAACEAVRLKAKRVAWAPVIRELNSQFSRIVTHLR
jgi:hypothetical protein